jgi:hypothetical protein
MFKLLLQAAREPSKSNALSEIGERCIKGTYTFSLQRLKYSFMPSLRSKKEALMLKPLPSVRPSVTSCQRLNRLSGFHHNVCRSPRA